MENSQSSKYCSSRFWGARGCFDRNTEMLLLATDEVSQHEFSEEWFYDWMYLL